MSVLSTSGLSVSFGGVHALVDVSLEVNAGELVGLIGPNGAGKTTCIDAITGFVPSRGRVELAGEDVSKLAPHRRAQRGLSRTWQSIELFDDLTVEKNLRVAEPNPSLWRTATEIVRGAGSASDVVDETLDLLELRADADRFPDELSQGRRKLVGVARALVQRPKVLLLDEPAAGLDTEESELFGNRIRSVVERTGVPMLLIDHDMGLVLAVCDRIVVLNFGSVIAEGPADEVVRDQRVIDAYLGSGGAGLRSEVDAELEAQEQQ